jgi:hypothetical protein
MIADGVVRRGPTTFNTAYMINMSSCQLMHTTFIDVRRQRGLILVSHIATTGHMLNWASLGSTQRPRNSHEWSQKLWAEVRRSKTSTKWCAWAHQ